MPVQTLAEVRQAVSARIAAEQSTWTASTYAFDWFGSDARTVAHRTYSVGITASEPEPGDVQRQRPREGRTLRESASVTVRWAWRLRGDAHVADQDEGLEAADAVLRAVQSAPGLQVAYRSSTFGSLASDSQAYLLGEMTFAATFHRPLE